VTHWPLHPTHLNQSSLTVLSLIVESRDDLSYSQSTWNKLLKHRIPYLNWFTQSALFSQWNNLILAYRSVLAPNTADCSSVPITNVFCLATPPWLVTRRASEGHGGVSLSRRAVRQDDRAVGTLQIREGWVLKHHRSLPCPTSSSWSISRTTQIWLCRESAPPNTLEHMSGLTPPLSFPPLAGNTPLLRMVRVDCSPARSGNNDTGAKGKLKCAGCRLSKIKVPLFRRISKSLNGSVSMMKRRIPLMWLVRIAIAEGWVAGVSSRGRKHSLIRLRWNMRKVAPRGSWGSIFAFSNGFRGWGRTMGRRRLLDWLNWWKLGLWRKRAIPLSSGARKKTLRWASLVYLFPPHSWRKQIGSLRLFDPRAWLRRNSGMDISVHQLHIMGIQIQEISLSMTSRWFRGQLLRCRRNRLSHGCSRSISNQICGLTLCFVLILSEVDRPIGLSAPFPEIGLGKFY